MDEFTPKGGFTPQDTYHPEDEYAPIDNPATPNDPAPVAPAAPVTPAPAPTPASAPVQPPVSPAYPQAPSHPGYPAYGAPYQQPYPQTPPTPHPAPQAPYYPGYAQQPVQPYYPQQPSRSYPAQGQYPTYPQQPMQQPTQQPMQQPMSQPIQQPYQPNGPANPYGQPSPAPYGMPMTPPPAPQPKPEKPKTPTGTKVFLIILSALLAAMIVGFSIYISSLSGKDRKQFSITDGDTDYNIEDLYKDIIKDIRGDDSKDNSNPFGGSSYQQNNFEEKITLVEDKGETQQRTDDNPDSVGTPDPKAKSIELLPLPKDKDDAKYTTQSAYDSVSDSVVTVELYEDKITDSPADVKGAGTGTIISEDGYIVTNAHVIGNSRIYAVNIVMNSGEEYQAKVVSYDTWTDLAVLKIDAEGLTPVIFGDSEFIEIGQDVIAIGSPGGEKFQNSLTKGIVSAVDREISINKYVRYIQSDAAISPGNSGGPLCNIYGQVIGINTAKTTATYYEAMTFSIPSDTVQEIITDLLHYGYVRGRARIGFSGTEVSAEEQTSYNMPSGIIVADIDESGALAGTGIKEGDIITAIDGEAVKTFQDIYAILRQHKAGDELTLSVCHMEEQGNE